MTFGICGGLDVGPAALEAGFDYVEVATSEYATKPDFDPAVYRAVHAEASNVFFPSTVRLFGDAATPYLDYVRTAVERAAQIGVHTIVIGSGTSRTAPPEVDPAVAEERFYDIVGEISAIARAKGIVVAPESLGRVETNVGTDLARLAIGLRHRGVAYTADSYHILYEWQADGGVGVPEEDLWEAQIPFLPAHVHLGTLPRSAPWATDALIQGFAARLHTLGYDGRVSVESALAAKDVATLRHVLAQMKELFG